MLFPAPSIHFGGRIRRLVCLWLSIGFFILCPLIVSAQSNAVALQLAVPESLFPLFDDVLTEQFQPNFPGIDVQLVAADEMLSTFEITTRLEDYLDAAAAAVRSADVLLVSTFSLSFESTRAGYFLDLDPLVAADASLDTADFYDPVWRAFQWDGGMWAFPMSTDAVGLFYDATAFDAAGLAYPTETWTQDELATAARTLAQRSSDGNVTAPGLYVSDIDVSLLMRSLLGRNFYDEAVIPTAPDFVSSELESVLATWAALEAEGVVTRQFNDQIDDIPMQIGRGHLLQNRGIVGGEQPRELRGVPLPGGNAGLGVSGFAVSVGTAYPEEANALAQFLSSSHDINSIFGGTIPARRSLLDGEANPDTGAVPSDPDVRAFVMEMVEKGLPPSDLLFGEYVSYALNFVLQGEDAQSALQEAEQMAVSALTIAEAERANTIIAVATPRPEVVSEPNNVALSFGIFTGSTSLSNRNLWDNVIENFVESDPQVSSITLNLLAPTTSDWMERMARMPEENDCLYTWYNDIDTFGVEQLLSLDPLVNADPWFSPDDVVGGVLDQAKRNDQLFALPMSVMPNVLYINLEAFADAGLPVPENGWTINEFLEALDSLHNVTPEQPVFYSYSPSGPHLFMLMAALGALPIDNRTDPPTLDYTDPETVEAIRQVLDLARHELMDYSQTAALMFSIMPASQPPGIFTRILRQDGGSSAYMMGREYAMSTFPTGDYMPVMYDFTAAYISADTLYPEACYRWISTIARHPELSGGMPAYRSVINDSLTAEAQGDDAVATYNRLDAMTMDSNAVLVSESVGDSFYAGLWLKRAFDRYVLEDADLEAELAEAELHTEAFLECVEEERSDEWNEASLQFLGVQQMCLRRIDPTMESIFPGSG